jgi:hypothetical protein
MHSREVIICESGIVSVSMTWVQVTDSPLSEALRDSNRLINCESLQLTSIPPYLVVEQCHAPQVG